MSDDHARIDLHGLDAERAKAAVLALLERAQAVGTLRVEIIHGRGKGVLAAMVRQTLKESPKVTDIGALDSAAGCGVWARLRKVSEMAKPAPGSASASAPRLARELLKQSLRLDPPR
jgi:hypothetical protein